MTNQRRPPRAVPTAWYRGADVPMAAIRRFARHVAERFRPDRIVLFGSHAYGKPHTDSDVDVLVVMPARNELDQAMRIRLAEDYPFPLDLIVRTPKNLAWRVAEGDSFLRAVVERGKTLYEKPHRPVGPQGGRRLPQRTPARRRPPARVCVRPVSNGTR